MSIAAFAMLAALVIVALSDANWTDLGVCGCCGFSPYYYYSYSAVRDTIYIPCIDHSVPRVIYGTLVNPTGDCGLYTPTSWMFVFNEASSSGSVFNWDAVDAFGNPVPGPSLAGCTLKYTLTYLCFFGTWVISDGNLVHDTAVFTTVNYGPPFFMQIDFTGANGAFPGCTCTGTYSVLITE